MFAQDFDAATFRKGFDRNLENPFDVRMAVRQARKYLLDYNASRQIIDLGAPAKWEDLTQLRQLARAPFKKIWVEFNNRARRERLIEVLETGEMAPPRDVFPRMAWLIETHDKQPSAHRATLVIEVSPTDDDDPFTDEIDKKSVGPHILPFSWWWDTEDSPTNPWGSSFMVSMNSEALARRDFSDIEPRFDITELALGKMGHKDSFVGLTKGYGQPRSTSKVYDKLAGEFAGELRYIMAFVAALTTTQIVEQSDVRTAPVKHSSGRTLPAFEYTEVKITVPKRRKLGPYIARHGHSGYRMREHAVSGFWRTYEHGEGPFCAGHHHTWELGGVPNKQNCVKCAAWRTWVAEHRRGDKELGVLEHLNKVVT